MSDSKSTPETKKTTTKKSTLKTKKVTPTPVTDDVQQVAPTPKKEAPTSRVRNRRRG